MASWIVSIVIFCEFFVKIMSVSSDVLRHEIISKDPLFELYSTVGSIYKNSKPGTVLDFDGPLRISKSV